LVYNSLIILTLTIVYTHMLCLSKAMMLFL